MAIDNLQIVCNASHDQNEQRERERTPGPGLQVVMATQLRWISVLLPGHLRVCLSLYVSTLKLDWYMQEQDGIRDSCGF